MATSKEYAYYVKGNKIALVQKDWTFSGGQTLSQPGLNDLGTIGALLWKSPIEDITDGLEIEYVYSPTYTITTSATTQVNKFYINGWTVKDGYLTFLRSHSASVPSWDASPYSAVGDDEYIAVKGSSRWSGLHKVKGGGIWLNNIFSTGDYIFVSGSEQAVNNGFWKVSDIQSSSTNEIDSGIYIKNRYYSETTGDSLDTEAEDTVPDTYATYDESITIYKAYRDFCYLQSDVDTLNDETDEIDVTRYQANAVVYYVRAKYAEDQGNIEMKEYFMREFRRMVEKHESSKVIGPRRLQGYSHFR